MYLGSFIAERTLGVLALAIASTLVPAFAQQPANSSGLDEALCLAAFAGNIPQIQQLLKQGVNVEAKCGLGQPLTEAAMGGKTDAVDFLLKNGADVEARDQQGCTALFRTDNIQIMSLLLSKGANIEDECNGNTPLSWAVESDDAEAVKFLLDHGANPNVKVGGFTLLSTAKAVADPSQGYSAKKRAAAVEIIRLLMDSPRLPAPPPSSEAAQTNYRRCNTNATGLNAKLFLASNTAEMQSLLNAGADINFCDFERGTLLEEYSYFRNVPVVEFLLDKGASVNDDDHGSTPLMAAGDAATAQALLAGGAHVNAKVRYTGMTPLMSQAKDGHTDVVKLLLEKGADPRIKDSEGRTALDYARRANHPDVAELLTATETTPASGVSGCGGDDFCTLFKEVLQARSGNFASIVTGQASPPEYHDVSWKTTATLPGALDCLVVRRTNENRFWYTCDFLKAEPNSTAAKNAYDRLLQKIAPLIPAGSSTHNHDHSDHDQSVCWSSPEGTITVDLDNTGGLIPFADVTEPDSFRVSLWIDTSSYCW
jgi:ankyrin repeat protein